MKHVFVLLLIAMVGISCTALQKSRLKVFSISVIDKNTGLPVDSARVFLTSIIESRDVCNQERYTNKSGLCSFQIEIDPSVQYRVATLKKGLLGYFDENYDRLDRSFASIDASKNHRIELFLTSDSLNHINYWAKTTPRYDIPVLTDLLRTNKFPAGSRIPMLAWEDIPGLLAIGNDATLITNFPHNVISSYYMNECYAGMIALWFIESIRITELKKTFDPFEKFPSQNPILLDSGAVPLQPTDIAGMEEAFQLYKVWWEKVKTMGKEQGCKVNPLEGTNVRWR
jgi:hypothetical protein